MPTYDINDPILIKAAEDSGLSAEYADDPALLKFYMKQLMTRGWAGILTETERKYTQLVRQAFGTGKSEDQIASFKERMKAYRKEARFGQFSSTTETPVA